MSTRIYALKSATGVASATHAAITRSTAKGVDPGPAGSPGMAEEVVLDRSITVTLYSLDPSELDALLEASAANVVLTYIGAGGVDKTITIKNVVFNDPCGIDLQAKSQGVSAQASAISGRAQWGSEDTWATMITYST